MKLKNFNFRCIEGTEYAVSIPIQDTLRRQYGIPHILLMRMLMIAISVILIARLGYLQIITGKQYQALAENNRIRIQEIKPIRGIIYDRNLVPLVKNQPSFTLMATPVDLYEQNYPIDRLINELSMIYPDAPELQGARVALASYSYIPVILKKNIRYEEGIQLIPKMENWPGIFLQENATRGYLFKDIFAHILGYTGFVDNDDLTHDSYYSLTDNVGKSGIELMYENALRGVKGKKYIEVNSLGKEDKLLDYAQPQKGDDIILTIDANLQEKLTEVLQNTMKKFGVTKSAAILLDPHTGEILALISLPAFNNNIFTVELNKNVYNELIQNPDTPLFNRAVSGEYPPGSTFKMIVGSAALEEKIIDENFSVLSVGGIRVGEWFFPDWLPQGHGRVDIREAVAWSVNTFFYIIGGGTEGFGGLGIEKINLFAAKFNIGSQTGVDLPNEASGFLPNPLWKKQNKKEQWYLGDTYHVSIGQGDLLVTPLQVALATSFFANSGTLYKPHIVKQKPQIIDKNFISEHTIDIMREGLRDAVRLGSARSLESLHIEAAGKTRNAQFSSF